MPVADEHWRTRGEYVMTRTTTVLAAMMIAGVGLTALSGCTPAREATVLETPSMSWQGAEPAFDLEDNAGVQYLRDYNLAVALAWNTGDFTLELLNESTSPADINGYAKQYAEQGDLPIIFRGPKAFEPISVVDTADGPLTVTVCEAVRSVYLTDLDPYAAERVEPVKEIEYRLKEISPGIYRFGDSTTVEASDEYPACLGLTIPVALFDTPPTMPELPVTDVVREPLIDADDIDPDDE